ncbi:MAG: hypothetical protein M0R06_05255 [Sphaerochaeta sp.]|jgi:hypothetical protein|nr:hypothetical protein [Sphaerochaeta sp.]
MGCDKSFRHGLDWFSATNTPSGFPAGAEGIQLGHKIIEGPTGREYRFVKFNLSGVSCKLGTPVALVSAFGVVTPDISDAKAASAADYIASFAFGGIALCSHTPASGSTTYGWVMTKGPLGKLVNSKLSGVTVKTFISTTASVTNGRMFSLRSTQDGFLAYQSTVGPTTAYRHMPNFVYYGAAVSAARKSVASGMIHSIW